MWYLVGWSNFLYDVDRKHALQGRQLSQLASNHSSVGTQIYGYFFTFIKVQFGKNTVLNVSNSWKWCFRKNLTNAPALHKYTTIDGSKWTKLALRLSRMKKANKFWQISENSMYLFLPNHSSVTNFKRSFIHLSHLNC